jgi:hypothetical protein
VPYFYFFICFFLLFFQWDAFCIVSHHVHNRLVLFVCGVSFLSTWKKEFVMNA